MAVLVSLFIVLPLVELILLVRLGRIVGFAPTFAFVIAMGVIGAVAARAQGRRVWKQWQEAIADGRVPEEGIVGGMLALLGAVLLITPGLLTDVLGLVLLVPVLRAPITKWVRRYLQGQISVGRIRFYGVGGAGPQPQAKVERRHETEVGRVRYRPNDVIDTQGEEVD